MFSSLRNELQYCEVSSGHGNAGDAFKLPACLVLCDLRVIDYGLQQLDDVCIVCEHGILYILSDGIEHKLPVALHEGRFIALFFRLMKFL